MEKDKPVLKQAQKSGLEVFSDNRTPQQPKVEKKEPMKAPKTSWMDQIV